MGRLNFEALENLQNSANELLHSPIIQKTLVDHRLEKHIHELSEASLQMLDVFGISKDVLLLVKEHLKDLQFTLRRVSIGEYSLDDIDAKISAYNCYRKSQLKKETLKCLNSLKATKGKSVISDKNLALVAEVLREVRVTTITIFESLLSFIAKPCLGSKPTKGSNGNTINICGSNLKCVSESDDIVSLNDFFHLMELQSENLRLEAVEITIDCIEVELECIFRRLIETRVSLLNILTTNLG